MTPSPYSIAAPGKNASRAEWAAWDAQADDNGRRLLELAEKGWGELQANERAAGS